MSVPTVQEPLRDRIGRAIYEEPGANANWYLLSEERREPWRKDADRVIEVVGTELKSEYERGFATGRAIEHTPSAW